MTDDPRMNLRLHFRQGLTFGRGKADLLQAVDEEGSISAAGRRMKMSYRRAWNLVEEMNAAFDPPLVDSSRGGSGGGGASLTAQGRRILAHYRALEDLLREAGKPHVAAMGEAMAPVAKAPVAQVPK